MAPGSSDMHQPNWKILQIHTNSLFFSYSILKELQKNLSDRPKIIEKFSQPADENGHILLPGYVWAQTCDLRWWGVYIFFHIYSSLILDAPLYITFLWRTYYIEMYRYQNLNRYRYRYRYWILKQNRYRYWTDTDIWIFQF